MVLQAPASFSCMLDRKVCGIKTPFTWNLYHKSTLQIIRQWSVGLVLPKSGIKPFLTRGLDETTISYLGYWTNALARNNEHLHINQIQWKFLHSNQHLITFLGIDLRLSKYKRGKYTFINAKIKVINTVLKVNRDTRKTLKCKHYSLTFLWHCLQFNSIPGQP